MSAGERRTTRAREHAPLVAGALLFLVYVLTLAPSVTFWDAGEFVAAVESFGVPHPPGTPLFVTIARAWRLLLWFLPAASATNLLSAGCTASACAVGGTILARRTGRPLAAAGATLCAGAMSSVWLNATETEVYSASLLLSALMLWAASRAQERAEPRWYVLLAFLFGLAAPLHASALVAAPVAMLLASRLLGTESVRSWWPALELAACFLAAAGIATGRWTLGIVGASALVLAGVRSRHSWRLLGALLLGLSPLVIMWVRAGFDPAINQGNPSTFQALLDVMARRQYAVAGPWPRQAPVWIQIGNLLEYADWQVALGLAPGTTPHVLRTPVTMAALVLAWIGARRLRRDERIAQRTMLCLALVASLGVVAYLNLKAGPSIGWGILPDTAPHEARERDYFFALAFWGWGLLAGYGTVRSAEDGDWVPRAWAGARGRAATGIAIAMLPLALNWRAVDRRREPHASAPARLAHRLLEDSPIGSVLFVYGDNDTYPLWFAQRALGVRRDVRVVTISLLSAAWYRAELGRRDSLVTPVWSGEPATVREVAAAARAAGRPVAFAATVPAAVRPASSHWSLCGTVWTEEATVCAAAPAVSLDAWLQAHPIRDVTDATTRSMLQPLRCPGLMARSRTSAEAADSLDSSCNAR